MSKLIMPSILRPPQYGFTDRSLRFAGNVSDAANVNNRIVNTQSFSVETMVKLNIPNMGSSGGWVMNERGSSNSGQYNYQLSYNTSLGFFRLTIRVMGNSFNVETSVVVTDTWYHVSGVCDAENGELRMYLNGVEEDNTSWSGTRDIQNTNFKLGLAGWATFAANTRFAGELSEVRVWDHARTAEQIKRYSKVPLRGSETGLLAYYPINEGSGNTTEDKTGNGNNLSLQNNPTWIT